MGSSQCSRQNNGPILHRSVTPYRYAEPMAHTPSATPVADSGYPGDEARLDALIREDQAAAVRRSLSITIPVNALLSAITFAVLAYQGRVELGGAWFAAACAVNLLRLAQCRRSLPFPAGQSATRGGEALRSAALLSFLSGVVWASLPLLSIGTGAESTFHVIVGAGITGGSIAMGFAYAPVAIGFVAPIIVSNCIYFALGGTFEQLCLAATIAIYFVALTRSALQSQTAFRIATSLKHEATALAASLQAANDRAVALAADMRHRALHDPLTNLLNRAGFLQELDHRRGRSSSTCRVMMLDLDRFKSINDVFGHRTGDQVLVEVSRRMVSSLPGDAALARLGGDEFAIVFNEGAADFDGPRIAERLIAAIGAPFADVDAGRIGLSIGIYDGPFADAADVIGYADEALFAAKEAGRGRSCVFDGELRRRLETRRDIERDLGEALRSGAVQVWYQPIFGDGGHRLDTVEALLRWNHPSHDWISPVEILNAAALAGQAQLLFGFIADQVCDMAQRLRALGRSDIRVAMNVSPREISQLPVVSLLLTRVRAAGLSADAIEIEITEETALDIGAVEGKLASLSGAGIRIAVDDFGVGYSSLATLRQFRADRIKVDRCFVTGLATSAENRTLVQAIIGLGRALNLDVVAEGIESNDDLLALRALGCQLMQGYHLGRPMPAETLLASLIEGTPRVAASAA